MGANFSDANLSGADLTSADLTYANFRNSTIKKANFNNVSVDTFHINMVHPSVNFERATLTHSTFIGALLYNVNFKHAIFMENNIGINFEGACLQNTDMRDANLSGTNFKSADLQQAQFNKYSHLSLLSSVDKANFRQATVDGRPITKNDIPSGTAIL